MHIKANTSCALAVSVAIALISAAPLVLPLNTLPPTMQAWAAGLLALAGVALNSYRAWQDTQEAEHEHVT